MIVAARLSSRRAVRPELSWGLTGRRRALDARGTPGILEPGLGLYVSIVLRLALGSESLPLAMLALGLATQQAIAEVTGLAPDLRWPNDVLLEEKKCAGILAQIEVDAVIAGIGINVGHASFPPDIAALATSLRLAGASTSRESLLAPLVKAVEDSCAVLTSSGPAAICDAFTRASSYAQGRRVRVEQDDAILEGVTAGLDASGFLLLRQDNGTVTKISTGGIRPI